MLRLFDDFEGENEIDDTEIVDDNEISQDRWIVRYVFISNQKRILLSLFLRKFVILFCEKKLLTNCQG